MSNPDNRKSFGQFFTAEERAKLRGRDSTSHSWAKTISAEVRGFGVPMAVVREWREAHRKKLRDLEYSAYGRALTE